MYLPLADAQSIKSLIHSSHSHELLVFPRPHVLGEPQIAQLDG